MRKIVLLTMVGLLTIFFNGCGSTSNSGKPIVAVSIAPLGYIVNRIADSTVDIIVTVPETTSPETYEMTAKQLAQISDAKLYFATGLIDFEQQLQKKITSIAPQTAYVNLSKNLELLDGTCGHDHSDGSSHNHLVDPHIWLSPRLVKTMAMNVAELLCQKNPEASELYSKNYDNFARQLDSLDHALSARFDTIDNKTFAIVHPSLTYFANDYGLNQVSIEENGKEPSVLKIKQIIDTLSANKVRTILYSRQNPNASAVQIASQIGAKTVEYDPLKGDWMNNITFLSNTICN